MESLVMENEAIKAALVISRVAGGEVIEYSIKNQDLFQEYLEISIELIEKFVTTKVDLSKYSISDKSLNKLEFDFKDFKIIIFEIKNDDIFLVVFCDNEIPFGITSLYLNAISNYLVMNY